MTSPNTRDPFECAPSTLKGTRILVVEDSWEIGTGLKMLLEARGAEVLGPAATVDDAKRLVSESIPDVALVDINLRKGERSYGLIDEIHALSVPIVVITGYAETSPMTGKVFAILRKPFSARNLVAALRSAKRN
jgi:two-component system, response regulator PdtaR